MNNITLSRDTVEQWLENLEYSDSDKNVIAAIKQSLAASAQDEAWRAEQKALADEAIVCATEALADPEHPATKAAMEHYGVQPEPEQKPVAWYDEEYDCAYTAAELDGGNVDGLLPLYTTPPAAPVQDEHQAFIDALPKDGEDKMFMQIDHWARESYKRHQSSVRGHMITAADAYESHVIWATLRWAKENTPPAAPVQSCYCPNCEALSKELAAFKAQPAPVQPVECQYGNGGYACCEGGPCKADEQNNAAAPVQKQVLGFEVVLDESLPPNTMKFVQPAPVQPAFKVGSLVTLNSISYPSLGQWFVQLWDGDEIAARVYGDSREIINRRIAALNTPPAPPAAQRQWVGLTDEDKLHIEIMGGKSDVMLAEMVEIKLKEKNYG